MTIGACLDVPAASANIIELADWIELWAMRSTNQSRSYQDLRQALEQPGTADALCDDIADDDSLLDTLAEDVFSELDDRFHACGGEDAAYPFSLEEQYLQLNPSMVDSPYVFLLLLSCFGKDASPRGQHPERLFEDICAAAAESYFGGSSNPYVASRVFGFPRRQLPKGFPSAVDELCRDLGEGLGSRERPKTRDQKDAKLDIVAWRDFPDRRAAKVIGFGQCATGENWSDKCSELQPGVWCSHWLRDSPLVTPLILFFVPHRVGQRDWGYTGRRAGVIFDRCRIAYHAGNLDAGLKTHCAGWSRDVIGAHVKQNPN